MKIAESVLFTLLEGSGNQHKCIAAEPKYRVEHSSGIVILEDRDSRQRLLIDSQNKAAGLFDLNEHATDELGMDEFSSQE